MFRICFVVCNLSPESLRQRIGCRAFVSLSDSFLFYFDENVLAVWGISSAMDAVFSFLYNSFLAELLRPLHATVSGCDQSQQLHSLINWQLGFSRALARCCVRTLSVAGTTRKSLWRTSNGTSYCACLGLFSSCGSAYPAA